MKINLTSGKTSSRGMGGDSCSTELMDSHKDMHAWLKNFVLVYGIKCSVNDII